MIRSFLLSLLLAPAAFAGDLSPEATAAADHAVEHYDDAQVELLAELVRFRTVHEDGIANAENPEFRAFAEHIGKTASKFGLDFQDYGAVLVVGLGAADRRIGVITHGDVQPADATKWQRSPFELDMESEPGRLIARGAEDDKAPIATALYAMKTIKERGLPLDRRIELIIGLTEESDHAPFLAVLEKHPPPEMNIGIDANYPVVVAEKGWGGTQVTFSTAGPHEHDAPLVTQFEGGAFMSQVPGDATIVMENASVAMARRVRERAARHEGMRYEIEHDNDTLTIRAFGKAAHSSEPWNGVNAITHAAALLSGEKLAPTPAGQALDFINTLIGTGIHGERFGDIAFSHPFMGPLTLNLSMVRGTDGSVTLGINTRAPAGKSASQLESEMRAAIVAWAKARGVTPPAVDVSLADAYLPEQPAQVKDLLAVFEHYTGIENPEPISIGGGTFARWLPNAVNFGPAMPGVAYTGHSTHEFITREQMTLNLRMYTAMLVSLATAAQ